MFESLYRLFRGQRVPGAGHRRALRVGQSSCSHVSRVYKRVPVSPDHEQCVTGQTAKNGIGTGAAKEAHGGGGGHRRL